MKIKKVNHTPTKYFKGITLEEHWNKTKLDVSHFCIFGSEAWAYILDEKRKSLEPNSETRIFVGYSQYVI